MIRGLRDERKEVKDITVGTVMSHQATAGLVSEGGSSAPGPQVTAGDRQVTETGKSRTVDKEGVQLHLQNSHRRSQYDQGYLCVFPLVNLRCRPWLT